MEARPFIEQLRQFGDRTAGGRGERASQEALAGLLNRLGYQARVEGCVCHLNPGLVWAIHSFCLVLGGLWGVTNPKAGLVLTLLTILSLHGEAAYRRRMFRWLLPKGISSNLIARRMAGKDEDIPRILFVAHGDVARRGLIHNRWLGRFFQGADSTTKVHPMRLALEVGWIQVALIALRFPGIHLEVLDVLLMIPVVLFAVVTLLSMDWSLPRPARGANDNGSGLAVLAALAEYFASHPLQHAEPCFLVTGSREADCGGVEAFLKTFGRTLPPENTFVVNIDDVGAGRICFAVGEKTPSRETYHPLLPGLAAALAREEDYKQVRPMLLLGLSDAGVASRHRYPAITLKGLRSGRPATPVHTGRDRIKLLSRGSITLAYRFAIALAERVDEQLDREQGTADKAPAP